MERCSARTYDLLAKELGNILDRAARWLLTLPDCNRARLSRNESSARQHLEKQHPECIDMAGNCRRFALACEQTKKPPGHFCA